MVNIPRLLGALVLFAALTPLAFAQGRSADDDADRAPTSLQAPSSELLPLPAPLPENDECHNNGPVANSPGTHAGGADESTLEGDDTKYGYGAQLDFNNEVADDFVVSEGDCDDLKGGINYAYQNGNPNITIREVHVTVYADAGGAPGAPVGDPDCSGTFAAAAVFMNVYRVLDVNGDDFRRLQRVAWAFPGDGCQPGNGVRWLGVSYHGHHSYSGPWQSPVPRAVGQTTCPTLVGNPAMQNLNDAGFAPVLNGTCNQDFPFALLGAPVCSLSLVSPDISPNSVEAGGRLTFSGEIVQAGPGSQGITLQATYAGPNGLDGTIPLADVSGVPPGTYPFSRPVGVPTFAPAGEYVISLQLIRTGTGEVCDEYTETITVLNPNAAGAVSPNAAWAVSPDAPGFLSPAAELEAATTSAIVSPNPFAGRTQIRYTVEAATTVRLSVYDVLGREVAVLVDGHVEAGAHQAMFDGHGLAPGTYVYRLTTGSEVQTGRMTLAH
jgi:hypothetical protein